jgi:2-dehydropantoate 2-reductase
MVMTKKMAVFGAGAVGSYIAAFLSRSGSDITLIDMWGDNVDHIRSNGMHVTGCQGDFNVPINVIHLSDAMQLTESFDIIFLSVKSYDTEWAAHFCKRLLKYDGVVVDNQNCMNDQLVASIVGYEREIACVMSSITVALWEPGHVDRGGKTGIATEHDVFRVGELHGRISKRSEEIASILSCIDNSRTTSNIWGERWSKLTTNASSNPISAMTGLGASSVAEIKGARSIQIHIAKESCQVGLAMNYQIEPIKKIEAHTWATADKGDIYENLDQVFMPTNHEEWKSSMSQDVTKGRKTEILFMNGYIADIGSKIGIPTPANEAITKIVDEIDRGLRLPNINNIDVVLNMLNI